MPRLFLPVAFLALGLVAFAAGRTQPSSPTPPAKPAEPPPPPPPPTPPTAKPAVPAPPGEFDVAEFAAQLQEATAPGPEHQVLDALAGTFKTESRLHVNPSGGPLQSRGTTTGKWILGKRFVQVDTRVGLDASKKELAGEALTIYGFDTRSRRYTVVALDTMGTHWVTADGEYVPSARELRLSGTVKEDGVPMRFKWTVKFEDKQHTTTVMIEVDTEQWFKASETVQQQE